MLRPMTPRLAGAFHVKHIRAGYGLVIDQVTDALFHVKRTQRRTAMYVFSSRDSMPKDSEASHGPADTIGSELPTSRELPVPPCAATGKPSTSGHTLHPAGTLSTARRPHFADDHHARHCEG